MKVTVFTPTYNRGHILENAYNSLKRQTVKDFEWLVVDDGSTDNTEELLVKWVQEKNDFPVRYFRTENGGKMRAANLGATEDRGELFLNLDSDDYLTDDAIELVISWEETIKDKKQIYAGVAGKKCYFNGEEIGTTFEGEYLDASYVDISKHNISGDKAEVFYTDLLRKHPFVVHPGEKFVSEGITWLEICCEENKMLRWFNKPLIKCEYLEDGYSANAIKLMRENPYGVLRAVKKNIEYLNLSFIDKIKQWNRYYFTAVYNGKDSREIREDLQITYIEYLVFKCARVVANIRKQLR